MPSNPSEYIQHHLLHWQWSPTGDTSSFWTFNLDTILMSILCGLIFLGIFRYVGQNMSVDKPGRFQLAIEAIFMMADEQVSSVVGKRDLWILSLALTLFCWIWIMNFMDLLPVDLLPVVANKFGIDTFRAVPTADLSMNLAMSFSVLLLSNRESISSHGLKSYLWEFASHPFSIYMFPANIILRVIEEFARPIGLAMRLWGNMFAGELVFFLIALSPFYFQWFIGWGWLGLHIFIITLQSFIFMMLSIVYMNLARQSH